MVNAPLPGQGPNVVNGLINGLRKYNMASVSGNLFLGFEEVVVEIGKDVFLDSGCTFPQLGNPDHAL